MSLREVGEALPMDHSHLGKMERGERPVPPDLIPQLDRIYEADGRIEAFHAAIMQLDRSGVGKLGTNPPLGDEEDEMERRAAIQLLAALGAGAAVPPDALNMIMSRAEQAVGEYARLDSDEWELTIFEHVHQLRANPPGAVLHEVSADFIEVSGLLSRVNSDLTRAALTRIAAQLAVVMALDLGDLGQQGAARRTYATARRLADASADRDLRVWVRAQEARNGFYAGRPAPVLLSLADQAIGIANGVDSPGLAMAYGAQAIVFADQGGREAACTALDHFVTIYDQRPTESDLSSWKWQAGGITRTTPYAYALLGDKRAAAAVDQTLGSCSPDQHGPIANAQLVQALSLVRERHIDDGLSLAAQIATSMPLSAARRLIAGQIIKALPEQARTLPAARELRELTTATASAV